MGLEKSGNKETYNPKIEDILSAKLTINKIIDETPLQLNRNLSEKYDCNLYLKREDLQIVRSYKIRGAYNKIKSLTEKELNAGIVCASAGNHAQGVAYSCQKLGISGSIYMPTTTPRQKVNQVKMFGKDKVKVVLIGDTYDDAYNAAMEECTEKNATFIHPFDDEKIIEGQATVGLEILEQIDVPVDYIIVPIGGGGLISGIGSYVKHMSPKTKIIGVEPEGAPAMKNSLEKGAVVELSIIDKFVDGAAVRKVGKTCLEVVQKVVDEIILAPEGKICTKILELYNFEAIVVEPAGALSIAALDFLADKIKGKNVVAILSGSNNDITRTEEIKERSLLYEGLKHYFIVRFPQRSGALRNFVNDVLGPNDDVTIFEYNKKNNRETGPALIGIEQPKREDLQPLIKRMEEMDLVFEYLNNKPDLFQYLI